MYVHICIFCVTISLALVDELHCEDEKKVITIPSINNPSRLLITLLGNPLLASESPYSPQQQQQQQQQLPRIMDTEMRHVHVSTAAGGGYISLYYVFHCISIKMFYALGFVLNQHSTVHSIASHLKSSM